MTLNLIDWRPLRFPIIRRALFRPGRSVRSRIDKLPPLFDFRSNAEQPKPRILRPLLLGRPNVLGRDGVRHQRQNTGVLDLCLHFPAKEIH